MSDATPGYQMTGAISLPGGSVAEFGHQGTDIVILQSNGRIALGPDRIDEFIEKFIRAQMAARRWREQHPEAPSE